MNSVVGRVIIFTLAGLAAGLLTWFVCDPAGFIHLDPRSGSGLTSGTMSPAELRDYYIAFCTWGGAIGVLLGVADTLMSGGRQEWMKVIGLGLAVGIIAGVIGGALGMSFFGALYRFPAKTPVDFLGNVFARAIGWAFIGALAGTADGWRKLSLAVGRNGFIGGLLGGLLGGMTFEIIPYLIPGIPPGPVSRLFGFAITGAMIGLFVALVQELLKEAWLKVMVGRNEGREILIYQTETYIGRSELSDVPIYGDNSVAKTHAVVRAVPGGKGFVIADVSNTSAGVYVNNQRISGEQPLRSGDQIAIGRHSIAFYERLTRQPTAPVNRDVAGPKSGSDTQPGGLPSLADLPTVPSGPTAANLGAANWTSADGPAPPLAVRPRTGNTIAGQLIMKGTRFTVTTGPYTGSTFPVRPNATIGRDPDADIALPADPKASRRHARLLGDGTNLAIEDTGSTNGTFVNGQRVTTRQTLATGDTIVIGTTTLRFE